MTWAYSLPENILWLMPWEEVIINNFLIKFIEGLIFFHIDLPDNYNILLCYKPRDFEITNWRTGRKSWVLNEDLVQEAKFKWGKDIYRKRMENLSVVYQLREHCQWQL